MSGMRRRLERLKESVRPELAADNENNPCGACGHGPGVRVEYEVEWVEDTDTVDDAPDFCPACGRQLSYVVTWPDDERK